MTESQRERCLKILEYYGFESQREILVEECAELIQSVSKMKRNGEKVSSSFIEELADVSIMVEQMLLALHDDELLEFQRCQDYKLKRQIARIEGGLLRNCTNCSVDCIKRKSKNGYCGNYIPRGEI